MPRTIAEPPADAPGSSADALCAQELHSDNDPFAHLADGLGSRIGASDRSREDVEGLQLFLTDPVQPDAQRRARLTQGLGRDIEPEPDRDDVAGAPGQTPPGREQSFGLLRSQRQAVGGTAQLRYRQALRQVGLSLRLGCVVWRLVALRGLLGREPEIQQRRLPGSPAPAVGAGARCRGLGRVRARGRASARTRRRSSLVRRSTQSSGRCRFSPRGVPQDILGEPPDLADFAAEKPSLDALRRRRVRQRQRLSRPRAGAVVGVEPRERLDVLAGGDEHRLRSP